MGTSRKCRRTPSTLEIPPTLEIPSTWILTSGTSGSSSSPDRPTMWEKRIFDERSTHTHRCWQYTLHQWRTKQVWRMGVSTRPFSVAYRKEAVQNKEDKTWQGVTFLWNLPLSNGGKNMEYWLKPVGEKEGWGRHPITMDCKMNECCSSNEVTWLLVHD